MTAQTINKSRSLLGANDLTLIAPIKPGLVPAPDARSYTTRLKVLLRTLQAARISSKEATKVPAITDVVDQIRAIRAFRLAIVGPEQNQLMLAVSFDGPWESYMRQIWRDMGPLLDVMFCNCDGYLLSHEHSYADYLGWVRSAQATTEYFYESSLLTVSDMHVLREQARAAIEPHVTPTTQPASAQETISQSMPALVALFGLTDLFPPQAGNADGSVLWRAARLLLKDLAETGVRDVPPAARTPTEQAAWRWFFTDRGGKPRQSLPDPVHDDVPDQVQGGILAPYPGVTHGALVLLELADGAAAQALLDTLLGTVSTARAAQGAQRERSPGDPRVFHNLAFTPAGLKRCGLGDGQTDELPPAFRDGMAARSGVLGDWDHNHPSRWALPRHRLADDGGPQRVQLSTVHAMLQVWLQDQPSDDWSDPVSAQARQRLHAEVERLEQAIAALEPADARSRRGAGVRVLAVEPMQRLSASSTDLPKGHFGYADGISQPWTRAGGRAPYNTDQDEVPLGDLLLGYGNGLLDDPQTGTLWVNGSFLVVRKLHQNVLAWRQALARDPDNQAAIEQQLMGRTVDGLVDLPDHPAALDNDFDYTNDPLGKACPFHAHIRRANPRTPRRPDLVRVPRIMRRGMSYGPRLASHATQDDGEDRGDEAGLDAQRAGVRPDRAVGLERDEEGAVGEEQPDEGEPTDEGHDAQQGEQVAVEEVVTLDVRVGPDRGAVDDVRQADAPQQCGEERPGGDGEVPALAPRVGVDLVAVVQTHAADDEGDEDEGQGEVEAAEKGGVPLREGREHRAARGEDPHLVAVPDRADGVEHDPLAGLGVGGAGGALLVAAAEDGQQHADPEVEAFEGEIADPEDGDEDEPDNLEG